MHLFENVLEVVTRPVFHKNFHNRVHVGLEHLSFQKIYVFVLVEDKFFTHAFQQKLVHFSKTAFMVFFGTFHVAEE